MSDCKKALSSMFILFFRLIIFCCCLPWLEISCKETANDFSFIEFTQGCKELLQHYNVKQLSGPSWNLLKQQYHQAQEFLQNKNSLTTTLPIPHLIHFIWVGPKPLPKDFERFLQSWRTKHPDWQIILWRDRDILKFRLKNYVAFRKAKNYGEKSDIARYEILYRMGGLYVDTDFECLRNFEELHHHFELYTGISYDLTGNLFNGLIGSIPGHPILQYCIEKIGKIDWNKVTYNGSGHEILQRTGPLLFTEAFFAHASTSLATVALPPIYFYPWPNFPECRRHAIHYIQNTEAYAVHHWHTSWLK